MNFKEKITNHLKEKNIEVTKVEQEGDNESIVCHISKEDNEKIENIKEQMEKGFDVAVMLVQSYGMNVVIIESNNL